MKKTVNSFKKAKENLEKLTMLTAYDYSTAKLVDQGGIDGILVGDSLGMVCLGYDNTLKVTMDDMIHHTKAVVRGVNQALVVADMPFMSYHLSVEDTVKNAGRLVKEGGADAVKLEGGRDFIEEIRAIIRAQIPVMGHLGLTPQSVNLLGGFKVQAKTKEAVEKLLDDARALEEAGVFALVLECVPEEIGKIVSQSLSIPTIGIGAGSYCDGQILVVNDMMGLYRDFTPKFVKLYGALDEEYDRAIKSYILEVKSGAFPEDKHNFKIDQSVLSSFKGED